MAYIWGVLAAIEPAFRTVTDGSDPWIRALMKMPASLADIGLALLLVYAFRATGRCGRWSPPRSSCSTRPSSTSAPGGASTRASTCCRPWPRSSSRSTGDNGLAAAALALCVMTKPQALPFVLPVRGLVLGARRAGASSSARRPSGWRSSSSLWLPFIPAGGPRRLSAQPGRLPERHLPDPVARGLEHLVARPDRRASGPLPATRGGHRADHAAPHRVRPDRAAVARRRGAHRARPAAADAHPGARRVDARSAFGFLTPMHERYAYGALIFLLLLVPERRFAGSPSRSASCSPSTCCGRLPPDGCRVFRDRRPRLAFTGSVGDDRHHGGHIGPPDATGHDEPVGAQDHRVGASRRRPGYSPADQPQPETAVIDTRTVTAARRRPDLADGVVVVASLARLRHAHVARPRPDLLRRRVGGHGRAADLARQLPPAVQRALAGRHDDRLPGAAGGGRAVDLHAVPGAARRPPSRRRRRGLRPGPACRRPMARGGHRRRRRVLRERLREPVLGDADRLRRGGRPRSRCLHPVRRATGSRPGDRGHGPVDRRDDDLGLRHLHARPARAGPAARSATPAARPGPGRAGRCLPRVVPRRSGDQGSAPRATRSRWMRC